MTNEELDALCERLGKRLTHQPDWLAREALAAIKALREQVLTVLQREAESQKRHDDKLDALEAEIKRRDVADWSDLPKDMYVTSVRRFAGAIGWEATVCNVPMATVPEVRYTLAALPPRAAIQGEQS